jgi:hypothetical protein
VRTSVKFLLITLAAGIPAFLLTPTLFPAPPDAPVPTDTQMIYFLGITAVETLFFGAGLAFLLLGVPMMRRVSRISGVSPWPAYVAIGYLTVSWWPHLGMHRVVGFNLDGLLMVDYGFHLPYILSAGVVAHFFFSALRAASAQATERPAESGRAESETVAVGPGTAADEAA